MVSISNFNSITSRDGAFAAAIAICRESLLLCSMKQSHQSNAAMRFSICAICQMLLAVAFSAEPIAAPIAVSGQSPFLDCPEVQSGHIQSTVEPCVSVNPADPRNIIAVWQQDRLTDEGALGIVAGVSLDGGLTWTNNVLHGLTPCSGGIYERASDPWVTFASNGDAYVSVNVFNLSDNLNAIVVLKSQDKGLSWGGVTTLIEDDTGPIDDKETITADPSDSDLVYAVWDRDGVPFFTRTTNAGATWESPRPVNTTVPLTKGSQIVVEANGTLLDFFSGCNPGSEILVVRSTDQGGTWSPPTIVATIVSVSLISPHSLTQIRTSASCNLFSVAQNKTSGALYLVWADGRFNKTQYSDIAFTVSNDGGINWSNPVRINKTPGTNVNRQAFNPSIAVTADGGIGVTYYDFRNNRRVPAKDGLSRALTDYWLVRCTSPKPGRSRAWGHEIRITPASFNIDNAPITGGQIFLGDYEGMTASGSDFMLIFNEPTSSSSAAIFFDRVLR